MSFSRKPSDKIGNEERSIICIIKEVPERGNPVTIVTVSIFFSIIKRETKLLKMMV
jgi:hypothetical protein